MMMFATGQTLKLWSFHHTMMDNRKLVIRVEEKRASDAKKITEVASPGIKKKEKSKTTVVKDDAHQFERLCATFGISEETMAIALEYPNNIKLGHFWRFMGLPTCCY